MDASIRGLPLLSGPAPIVEEPNRYGCRKCGKEFGIFTRSRACNHCGFTYCTSCSDHTALVARSDGEPGYDAVPVCAFCIPNLTITASGRTQLRAQTVASLRAYMKAYGLSVPQNVLEKEEIVDAVLAARGPNGCLPPANEDYYRKHSVPNRTPERRSRSLFSRMTGVDTPSAPSSPRPSPAPRPNAQTRPQGAQRPANANATRPNPQSQSQYNIPSNSPYSYRPPQPAQSTRPRTNNTNTNAPPRPATETRPSASTNAHANANVGPAVPPRPPRTPVPSMDALLEMPPTDLHALSVGTLKQILYENHVIASQILEKDDLVAKVQVLLDAERRDRAREAEIHAQEEAAYLEQQRIMREEFLRGEAEREHAREEAIARRRSGDSSHAGGAPAPEVHVEGAAAAQEGSTGHNMGDGHGEHDHTPDHDHEHLDVPDNASVHSHTSSKHSATGTPSSVPTAKSYGVPPSTVERSGLCVICQDEEANIVVVDCGHLAMCRNCSDLVMSTNRECPLCRTRIVTPQRLLRVFRT